MRYPLLSADWTKPLDRPRCLPSLESLERRLPVSDTLLGAVQASLVMATSLGDLTSGAATPTAQRPAIAKTFAIAADHSESLTVRWNAWLVEGNEGSAGRRVSSEARSDAGPDNDLSAAVAIRPFEADLLPLEEVAPRHRPGQTGLPAPIRPRPIAGSEGAAAILSGSSATSVSRTGTAAGDPGKPATDRAQVGGTPLAYWELLAAVRAVPANLPIARFPGAPEASATPPPFEQPPLRFQSNVGQFPAAVKFLTSDPGYTLALTPQEVLFASNQGGEGTQFGLPPVIPMQLAGGNPSAPIVGLDPLPGYFNYDLGQQPANWYNHVPTFARAAYQGVYPGIDLVFYSNQNQLEYDFVVAPGASPAAIQLKFAGADRVALDDLGNLVIDVGGVQLRHDKPFIYQEANGVRTSVPGSYQLSAQGQVSFAVGAYDHGRPLVIDPYVNFATFLGGSGTDQGRAIAADALGNSYTTGFTDSPNFPGGGPPGRNVFVTQFTADGTWGYTTILGSATDCGDSQGLGIAVDATFIYVTGFTEAPDFPVTSNGFQQQLTDRRAAFVVQLDLLQGGEVYGTLLTSVTGQNPRSMEEGRGIAVDPQGYFYVTGITSSRDFPIQNADGLQPFFSDEQTSAFVTKFVPDGSSLDYSTFFGGSGNENVGFNLRGQADVISGAIAVDAPGNAYITGTTTSPDLRTTPGATEPIYGGGKRQALSNAFVFAIAGQDRFFQFITYLGGEREDQGHGIAVDLQDNIYVTGATSSPRLFPRVNAMQPNYGGGPFDAFMTKFLPGDADYVYSTFLGGSGNDQGHAIAVAPLSGDAFVTGETDSASGFPLQFPLQKTPGGGRDFFETKLDAQGSLFFSTYLGGRGDDVGRGIALAPPGPTGVACRGASPFGPDGESCDGSADLAGYSSGSNFPVLHNAFGFGGGDYDAVVATLPDCPSTPTNISVGTPVMGLDGWEVPVSWDDASPYYTDMGGGFTIDYPPGGSTTVTASSGMTSYSTDITGLPDGTYNVQISAYNNCCVSPASSGISVTIPPA